MEKKNVFGVEKEIEKVLKEKQLTIERKDWDQYQNTITQKDSYYLAEQKRWFSEMTNSLVKDVSFEVEEGNQIDKTHYVAKIHQTHWYRTEFSISYPLLFVKEGGQWKDCGYAFLTISHPKYILKYTEEEQNVMAFEKMIEEAYENMQSIFGETKETQFQIKLFSDQEILRQRTVPTIGWLFTGWGEPDESLKLYTGQRPLEGYLGTIQHELVHHVTVQMCQNNLSEWLLEGVAIYFGNAWVQKGKIEDISHFDIQKIGWTIEELEDMNLYENAKQEDTMNWYNACYGYVAFLVEEFGEEKIRQLFERAGSYPLHSSLDSDFAKINNKITGNLLKEVLDHDKEELSKEYLSWLEDTDFFKREKNKNKNP